MVIRKSGTHCDGYEDSPDAVPVAHSAPTCGSDESVPLFSTSVRIHYVLMTMRADFLVGSKRKSL